MARVRKAEALQSSKENQVFSLTREIQGKEMELKNLGIVEFNIRSELDLH